MGERVFRYLHHPFNFKRMDGSGYDIGMGATIAELHGPNDGPYSVPSTPVERIRSRSETPTDIEREEI